MICPHCKMEYNNIVIDSRRPIAANTIRRRRQCLSCGYKFTTYEVPSSFILKRRIRLAKDKDLIDLMEIGNEGIYSKQKHSQLRRG